MKNKKIKKNKKQETSEEDVTDEEHEEDHEDDDVVVVTDLLLSKFRTASFFTTCLAKYPTEVQNYYRDQPVEFLKQAVYCIASHNPYQVWLAHHSASLFCM